MSGQEALGWHPFFNDAARDHLAALQRRPACSYCGSASIRCHVGESSDPG